MTHDPSRVPASAVPTLPRLLWLLAALAAPLACTSDRACPTGFSSLGTFSIAFTAADSGAACVVTRTTDGGPADAALVVTPQATSLWLCASASGDAGDAGLSLSLQFPGSGASTTGLDGGSFSLVSSSSGVSGSACLCPLDVSQVLSGSLRTADGGVFGVEGDGGLSQVVGVAGSLVDGFAATGGAAGCACTLPCSAAYSYGSQ